MGDNVVSAHRHIFLYRDAEHLMLAKDCFALK